MKVLSDIYKRGGQLHHAYALQGASEALLPQLLKFLEQDFDVVIKNNPDFFYQKFETFSIDDTRALQDRHLRRAISSKKIFIISTRFITTEAQNALLKIFEEPTAATYFFIILQNTAILLPTLRSRMMILDQAIPNENDTKAKNLLKNNSAKLAEKFIAASMPERLLLIKNIVEEKDKGKAIDFVNALEQTLAPRLKDPDKNENMQKSTYVNTLGEILMVNKYLHDRAPGVKILLEHLCLICPVSPNT